MVAAAFTLAGCGGGGGDDPASTPAPSASAPADSGLTADQQAALLRRTYLELHLLPMLPYANDLAANAGNDPADPDVACSALSTRPCAVFAGSFVGGLLKTTQVGSEAQGTASAQASTLQIKGALGVNSTFAGRYDTTTTETVNGTTTTLVAVGQPLIGATAQATLGGLLAYSGGAVKLTQVRGATDADAVETWELQNLRFTAYGQAVVASGSYTRAFSSTSTLRGLLQLDTSSGALIGRVRLVGPDIVVEPASGASQALR